MNSISNSIENFIGFFTTETNEILVAKIWTIVQFIAMLFVISLFFRIVNSIVKKITVKKCSLQIQYVINKIIRYAGFAVMVLTTFHRLGIDISAILGAAGIAGVAIGFAAQTSISNVFSGLFVITALTPVLVYHDGTNYFSHNVIDMCLLSMAILRIIHILTVEGINVFKHLLGFNGRTFRIECDRFHIGFHGTFEVTLSAKLIAKCVKFFGCHVIKCLCLNKITMHKDFQQTFGIILSYIKIVLLKSAHTS